jgi:ribosomal-protein-alanine N-acetyltransferase
MKPRRATAADIPQMMQFAETSPEAGQWSRRQYEALFSDLAPDRLVWIVEASGFLVAHHVGQEWEIENLAVAVQARRRGIASRLVRALLDEAREHGGSAVFLEVRESNQAARSLYGKLGFEMAGMRPGYYGGSENACLYRRGV